MTTMRQLLVEKGHEAFSLPRMTPTALGKMAEKNVGALRKMPWPDAPR